MAEAQLEANVRLERGAAIIDLRGDITAFAKPALRAAYDQADATQPKAVVLNFSEVQYINSTGIALIVSLLARARQDQHKVISFGLSNHYLEIFEITRLSDFILLVPDEAAVLRAIQSEENS